MGRETYELVHIVVHYVKQWAINFWINHLFLHINYQLVWVNCKQILKQNSPRDLLRNRMVIIIRWWLFCCGWRDWQWRWRFWIFRLVLTAQSFALTGRSIDPMKLGEICADPPYETAYYIQNSGLFKQHLFLDTFSSVLDTFSGLELCWLCMDLWAALLIMLDITSYIFMNEQNIMQKYLYPVPLSSYIRCEPLYILEWQWLSPTIQTQCG